MTANASTGKSDTREIRRSSESRRDATICSRARECPGRAYMSGILTNHGMHAVAIGGIEDHIHALINLGASLGIAKPVQLLKANASRWMNEHPGTRFAWQNGYFAGSVSRSADCRCQQIYCEPARTPQEGGFCWRTRRAFEKTWVRSARAVPSLPLKGLETSLPASGRSRARL